MQQVMTKELAEKLGLTWRQDELDAMSTAELRAGYVNFFIPDPPDLDSDNGKTGWAWVDVEGMEKYDDDQYTGKLTAVLCMAVRRRSSVWCGSCPPVQRGTCADFRPGMDTGEAD